MTVTLAYRLGQCFMKPAAQDMPASSAPTLHGPGTKSTFKKPLQTKAAAMHNTAPCANPAAKQPIKQQWQHNPNAEGAIVLNKAQWQQGEAKGVMPVVLDPHLARKLRPHQSQGVQFMYECVMGMREANRQDSGLRSCMHTAPSCDVTLKSTAVQALHKVILRKVCLFISEQAIHAVMLHTPLVTCTALRTMPMLSGYLVWVSGHMHNMLTHCKLGCGCSLQLSSTSASIYTEYSGTTLWHEPHVIGHSQLLRLLTTLLANIQIWSSIG